MQDTNATLEQRVIDRTLALTKSETHLRQFKAAVEQSSASILIADRKGIITYANPALARITQYTLDEVLGRPANMFRSAETPEGTFRAMGEMVSSGQSWRGELLNKSKDGAAHWQDVSISPVTDANGRITHFVAVGDEISERKKLEQELRYLATVDPLTGLLNRRSFFSLAEQEIVRLRRQSDFLAVAMLDVDHFKTINDVYGHRAGDDVLRALAESCTDSMRERDFMGRLGGEEFACVLPGTSMEQAMLAAERLRTAISRKKIRLADGKEVSITVSIGVATFQPTDTSIETVLHRADLALYRAKMDGRDCIRSTV